MELGYFVLTVNTDLVGHNWVTTLLICVGRFCLCNREFHSPILFKTMPQAEEIIKNRYQLKQKLGDNTARQTWLATDLESPENL